MFYYLYEITNNINGKIYIGVHQTKKLEDGYMGSGKILLQSIKKYGIHNFTKNIIEFFDNSEDMYKAEFLIVDHLFISRKDTYNLKEGGCGGFSYLIENGIHISTFNKGKILTEEHKQKISESLKKKYENGEWDYVREQSRERMIDNNPLHNSDIKQKVSDSLKKYKKTEEHKNNLSKSCKGKKHKKPDAPRKRQPLSEETKRKISESRKCRNNSA